MKEDFLRPGEIKSLTVNFRGHDVLVKTITANDADMFYKYCADNNLKGALFANAALISASLYYQDNTRIFEPSDIEHVAQYTDAEIKMLLNKNAEVGNLLIDDQEKKE